MVLVACGTQVSVEVVESDLNASERRARCEIIRDVARGRGLSNGVLLGGIGDAETGLAHCWSEATWACQGPTATSCGDGPVIAGAGDGPCSLEQGGLGLFQFDGGTYAQTLARDGEAILEIDGNVSHAVDFVLAMVVRSQHVDISNEDDALAWMNQIPIEPGNDDYEAWVSTVTHHYNGCSPSAGCWEERRARYEAKTRGVYDELGADFWQTEPIVPEPCLPIAPSEARIIEESDPCYDDRGPSASWRTVDAGHGGRLRWTYAFEAAAPENYATWNLAFDEAGDYLVEVFTPAPHAESARARYVVRHAGMIDEVPIDQGAADGFQPLGELSFAAGGDQWIRLDDNTGEPLADGIQLVFDAIRVTPVAGDPPVVNDEPPPIDVVPGWVDRPRAREAPPGTDGEIHGGCVCLRSSDPSWLALVVVLMVVRKKKTPRRKASPRKTLLDFALSLPGAYPDHPWGETVAKVGKKVFVFLGHDERAVGFSAKLPASSEAALLLPFAKPTGYGLGKSGWVTASFDEGEDVPVDLLLGWIEESYRAIAPKKLVAELDGAPARGSKTRPKPA